MKIRIDGRTNLHNYYPESWQRRDSQKSPRSTGVFTTKRTRQVAVCVGKVHADLIRRNAYRSYFLTHTSAPDLVVPRPVGQVAPNINRWRREQFALLLDLLRKQQGFVGYYWTTERHSGGGPNEGTIHHHAVVYFNGPWSYKRHVRRWSLRYCRSVNGLDIAPCKGGNAGAYIAKALGYTIKDMVGGDSLPFKWWGTTSVVRYVEGYLDEHPVTTPPFNPDNPYTVRCAVVADSTAIALCSDATQQRKLEKLKKKLLLKSHKGKRCPTHPGKIGKQ